MNMNEILQMNSIPVLESELKTIHEDFFRISPKEKELIVLFQKELLIRVRIKQIEQIIHS